MEFKLITSIKINEEDLEEMTTRVLDGEEFFDTYDIIFCRYLEIDVNKLEEFYQLIEEEVMKRVEFRKNRDKLNKAYKVIRT